MLNDCLLYRRETWSSLMSRLWNCRARGIGPGERGTSCASGRRQLRHRWRRSPGDQEEVTRLRAELLAQQTLARGLQQIVTDIVRSRSWSRSGVSVNRATGAFVGQYLAGSSSRRRNEEEERHRQGEGSAHDGRGGGKMLPPPDRREGSGESGGGQ
ncbi:hypothetical protein Taro_002951 [Colocasia esculenta]|uniref:Uncharacterized protein n=1 Tax=Colocasia esculenta TaxID=4460 RepID=A0A843TIF1_COLES|nr:hypothetical protein [Colocasia esculenta]